jgi:hypothetical protein
LLALEKDELKIKFDYKNLSEIRNVTVMNKYKPIDTEIEGFLKTRY